MGLLGKLLSTIKGKTPITRVNKKVLLCGKTYSIKLQGGARNSCKVEENVLYFTLKEMTRECFNKYFSEWYRRQSRKLFQQSRDKWRRQMERYGYHLPPQITLKIYRMRRAWGRCYYTKGVITLNMHLAATPQQCIDYILLHEMCHFLFHNHGTEFYATVERLEPNWRGHERQLSHFAMEHRLF